MVRDTSGKYFIKNVLEADFEDISSMFSGVFVLKAENLGARGKAVNVYHEQWVNSQREDFLIAGEDGRIVRSNPDITITFIVGRKYAAKDGWYILDKGLGKCRTFIDDDLYISDALCILEDGEKIVTDKEVSFYRYNGTTRVPLGVGTSYINDTGSSINALYISTENPSNVEWRKYTDDDTKYDEQTIYDNFVDYMTSTDVWFASAYLNKQVHCVSSNDVKAKEVKVQRGVNSFIIGEITMHALENATAIEIEKSPLTPPTVVVIEYPPCYYGFNTLSSVSSIDELEQTLTKEDLQSITGQYTLTAATDGYLWLCVPSSMSVNRVEAYNFQVPMEADTETIVGYKCYRSSYEIVAGTYTINVNPNS